MQIDLASQFYTRSDRGLPPEKLVNMVQEPRPDGRTALIATGGCTPFTIVGSAIRGLFQMDGVLGGDVIVIGASAVYRVTSAGVVSTIGAISAPSIARIATSLTETVAVIDGNAYQILSSGVNQLLDPDLGQVIDVVYGAGLFIYVEKDSDRIKWSEVLNAGVIGSASFATAEKRPDRLRGCAMVGEDLVLFGYETTEIWGATGDITAPFAPRSGATSSIGCASRDSITPFNDDQVGNRVAWLANDRTIRISMGGGAQNVTPFSLAEELSTLTNDQLLAVNGYTWSEEGRNMVAFTLPASTWVMDVGTGLWHKRSTLDGPLAINSTTEAWGKQLVGRMDSNALGVMDTRERYDMGNIIVRNWTGTVPIDSDAFPIDTLTTRLALGDDPDVDTERFIWMRYSDTRGRIWSDWQRRSLGEQGRYRSSVEWGPLGAAEAPGRIFEFEIRDPYRPTVSAIFVNEVKA